MITKPITLSTPCKLVKPINLKTTCHPINLHAVGQQKQDLQYIE
ncbi:hypothetical protein PALI_a1428 [Pseudoalteromonas aliena SW19]|uniref:Uncharacterized protein n=1 Tax=Pseudoalteromonas aliena SW19 TaxID=1314866 RepID=A0ABR9DYC4_9GAMM|nr:hypothetical protein [Pseudoalteromonas aliena SW19]